MAPRTQSWLCQVHSEECMSFLVSLRLSVTRRGDVLGGVVWFGLIPRKKWPYCENGKIRCLAVRL